MPSSALYINGVFEETLQGILAAQTATPGLICMLQPYSSARIKLLANEPPSPEQPTALYMSTTTGLTQVAYRAKIVDWKDKRLLSETEREALNRRIATHQPTENDVYLQVNGKACVNLIFVSQLERLPSPVPVTCFVKVGDERELKPRRRAGGFAYVHEQPAWLGTLPTILEQDLEKSLHAELDVSAHSSAKERALRLAAAPKKPAEVQVVSRAFRRNPDVIVEVLNRAAGRCELCNAPAPFLRLSDGSPYLEVHHKITLAAGGDDTVDNAYALCPNCHRHEHFGQPSEA
jgi:5-methylcytosine-specific restriction endonuclease McrA